MNTRTRKHIGLIVSFALVTNSLLPAGLETLNPAAR
jgi:hypothetical protein